MLCGRRALCTMCAHGAFAWAACGVALRKPYCYGWMENSLVAVIEFRPLGLRVPVQFTAVFLFILHCSFVKPLMEEKNSFCVVLENKLNMFMFG